LEKNISQKKTKIEAQKATLYALNGARSLYRTRHYIENNIYIELISYKKNNIEDFVLFLIM
jgi:hypothetical protein